jgi:hypothetical protein
VLFATRRFAKPCGRHEGFRPLQCVDSSQDAGERGGKASVNSSSADEYYIARQVLKSCPVGLLLSNTVATVTPVSSENSVRNIHG